MENKADKIEYLLDSWYNKSRKSLYYFCKVILGFKDLRYRTHSELCLYLEREDLKNKLVLMPRGTFKTTIGVIGYSIWKKLFRNPDLRILISSDTYANAIKSLFEIKQICETNEKLKLLFGNLIGKRWREDEIDFSVKRRYSKEPCITVGSQDVTRVGQHYDLIILDDIVTDVNTQTEEQMKKTVEYFRSLYSILEPDGEMLVIGTRWSYNRWELYQYILDNLRDNFKEVLIKKAIDDNGELFFPERLSKEKLNELLRLQGSYLFSSQYLNTPVNFDEQLFKKVITFDRLDEVSRDLSITMTVDPAIGLDEGNDYTGIVVCGMDGKQDIYVLDALRMRVRPNELIDTLFYLKRKWGVKFTGIETVAFQKALKYFIDQEEQRRGINLGIIELKTDTRKSKFSRILGLQPFIERGQLKVYSKLTELLEELYSYPRSPHDDLVDALSYQLQIIAPPPPEEAEIVVQDDWDRYIEAKKMGKAVKPPWWYRIKEREVLEYD